MAQLAVYKKVAKHILAIFYYCIHRCQKPVHCLAQLFPMKDNSSIFDCQFGRFVTIFKDQDTVHKYTQAHGAARCCAEQLFSTIVSMSLERIYG